MHWDTTTSAPVDYLFGTTATTPTPLDYYWHNILSQNGTTLREFVIDTILDLKDTDDSEEQDRVAELDELDEFLDEFRH